MRALVASLTLLAAFPMPAQGQARYTPTFATPHGTELVAVFISSSFCVGSRTPGLHEAIEAAKLQLADRAKREGRTFRAVAVALDWAPDSGLAYLREFGQFDELVIGSNWFNLGVSTLIWADSATTPAIPQLLVFERTVDRSQPRRMSLGSPNVLRRIAGGDSIVTQVGKGALR